MTIRQEFEAWAEGRYSTWKASDGSYVYDETQSACFAWEAATSRQEARIKALRDSLNWALSSIIEEPYEWSSEENTDAHNAAIAAAKE